MQNRAVAYEQRSNIWNQVPGFFLFLAHDNNQQKAKTFTIDLLACVPLLAKIRKTTQIIQKVGHLLLYFLTLQDRKWFLHISTANANHWRGGKVGVGENFDRCAPICLHTCFSVISSLAFSITFLKMYKRYIMFTSFFFFQRTFYSMRNHFVVHIKNKFLLLLTKVPTLKKCLNFV